MADLALRREDVSTEQDGAVRWPVWAASAFVHGTIVLIGFVMALTSVRPLPLPPNAIVVTLTFEPSAPNDPQPIPAPPAQPREPAAPLSQSPAPSPEPPSPEPPSPEPPRRDLPETAAPTEPPPKQQPAAPPPPETAHDAGAALSPPVPPRPRPKPPLTTARSPAVPPTAVPSTAAPSTAAGPVPPRPPSPGTPVPVQQALAPVIPARPVSGLSGYRKPDYPVEARSRHLQGRVLLRVQVSAAGTAMAVDVVSSSGHAMLDQAALVAVQTWHFIPATQAGMPVPAPLDVPIDFKMDD